VVHDASIGREMLAHSSRGSGLPHEAGLEVFVPACTTGFTMYIGGWKGTTAGHCRNVGDPVQLGASGLIGTVVSDWNPTAPGPANGTTAADTLDFTISAGNATPRIYTSVNSHRTVTGAFGSGGVSSGSLCMSGRNSGTGCGAVTGNDVDMMVNGVMNLHTGTIARTCLSGDSGGPVYATPSSTAATAAGTVISCTTNLTRFSMVYWIAHTTSGAIAVG
jgi:hypothetical protein